MKSVAFVVATVGLCGGYAAAQPALPVVASRSVSVDSFVVDLNSYSSAYDGDQGSSATLVPFDRTLDRYLTLGLQRATTYSRQKSTITPQGLDVAITLDETAKSPSPGLAFGHSVSQFSAQYVITQTTRARLIATVTALEDAGADSVATFQVTGPLGPVSTITRSSSGTSSSSDVVTLAPGTYQFKASGDVSAETSPSPTMLHARVVIAATVQFLCPADFDLSGFVDTDDFTAFVAAFELGDQSADVDATGFVDTDDFTAFVAAFEKAC